MPSAEQITDTVNRYLDCATRGAVDEIAELYASDATVEDPVGGEVHIGREAIKGFYAAMVGAGEFEANVITLRALGHEAAFYWTLTVKAADSGGMRISIISVMTFTEDSQIASMKAYWTSADVTQL